MMRTAVDVDVVVVVVDDDDSVVVIVVVVLVVVMVVAIDAHIAFASSLALHVSQAYYKKY